MEPSQRPQQIAHRRRLLLIRQYLNLSRSCGGVDRHMGPLVAPARGRVEVTITSDPVTYQYKTG